MNDVCIRLFFMSVQYRMPFVCNFSEWDELSHHWKDGSERALCRSRRNQRKVTTEFFFFKAARVGRIVTPWQHADIWDWRTGRQANIWVSAGSQRHQKPVKMSVYLRRHHNFKWLTPLTAKPGAYRMQSADFFFIYFFFLLLTFNSSRFLVQHQMPHCKKVPLALCFLVSLTYPGLGWC